MARETESLSVLVVDDEPHARRYLRQLLTEQLGVGDVREARNGVEAIEQIRADPPSLVLLDVQMPQVDGFEVIERVGLNDMPPVVFVTAYDQHAVRAFEVNAVDYVLKPIDPERLRDAIERARSAINRAPSAAATTGTQQTVMKLLQEIRSIAATSPAHRIALRDGRRTVFVARNEIDWVESMGNYARFHITGGATLRQRATMDNVAEALGPEFVRIRRSTLVRRGAIRIVEPLGRGTFTVILNDRSTLSTSRYYREQLLPLLGS
jgi:two-component system LytT family response regulator